MGTSGPYLSGAGFCLSIRGPFANRAYQGAVAAVTNSCTPVASNSTRSLPCSLMGVKSGCCDAGAFGRLQGRHPSPSSFQRLHPLALGHATSAIAPPSFPCDLPVIKTLLATGGPRMISTSQGHVVKPVQSLWPCEVTHARVLGLRMWTFGGHFSAISFREGCCVSRNPTWRTWPGQPCAL